MKALQEIAASTRGSLMVVMAGLPLNIKGRLFNCAAVIQDGDILGFVVKTHIPGYNEFYENRWFSRAELLDIQEIRIGDKAVPIGNDLIFACEDNDNFCFGVEICEDLWVPVPQSGFLAQAGAVLLFNLSASNERVGKASYRASLVEIQSGRCVAGYVYSSCNIGESSTDLVFGGHNIIAENGVIAAQSDRFLNTSDLISYDIDIDGLLSYRTAMGACHSGQNARGYRRVMFKACPSRRETLQRRIDRHPLCRTARDRGMTLPRGPVHTNIRPCDKDAAYWPVTACYRHFRRSGLHPCPDRDCTGHETARPFHQNIMAVTMPGFGTTDRTYSNAVSLIKGLGAEFREINIRESCLQHFRDIGHDPEDHDTTYENTHARERMQILMDLANKHNGLVVGTGDMSELALGWCTYNGDHMSMYGVNSGVPKTLICHILRWYADNEADDVIKGVLHDILDTPISPELLPPSESGKIGQKPEDVLGPYEVHDFFLYHVVRWGSPPAKVLWLAQHASAEHIPGSSSWHGSRCSINASSRSNSSVPASRRAKGGQHKLVAKGRLAHAQRCVAPAVAQGTGGDVTGCFRYPQVIFACPRDQVRVPPACIRTSLILIRACPVHVRVFPDGYG